MRLVLLWIVAGGVLVPAGPGRAFAEEAKGGTALYQDVSFTSRLDDTTQRYLLRRPDGWNADQPCDVLICLHGHGSDRHQYLAAERGETTGAREVAAKHQMVLVSPDYRGNSWMGAAAEADLVQTIGDLKAQMRVRRVFLTGGSMGGTSVLIFAALHPELVAGVASQNGMADLGEYDAYLDTHPLLDIQAAIRKAYGGTREQAPAEFDRRSPARHAERLTMPVAIATGGKDTMVPPDSALRLAGRLKEMGRPVLLLHRPEGDHETNLADTKASIEFAIEQAEKGQ